MAEVNKKIEKRTGLFEGLFGSSDVTKEQIIRDLYTIDDKTLGMIANVNNPVVMAIGDMLASRWKDKKYTVGPMFYNLLRHIRINSCAKHGLRVEQVKDSWVAVSHLDLFKEDKVKDKLFRDKR